MAEVKQYIRSVKNNGDVVLTNIIDSVTGELTEYIKVTSPTGIEPLGPIYKTMGSGASIEVFKRIYDGSIKAKWFGCKGDGVTNDTAKFQEALDTAAELSSTLELDSNKTYLVTNTLTLNGGGITLNGNGSKIKKIGTITSLIEINSNNNKINNTKFIGNYASQIGDLFIKGNNNVIHECDFQEISSTGIVLENNVGNIVNGCNFSDKAYGVTIRNSYGNIITNNYFTRGYRKGVPIAGNGGWAVLPLGDAIKFTSGPDASWKGGLRTIISNNVMDGVYRDAADFFTHGEWIIFSNNIIKNIDTFGLDIKTVYGNDGEDATSIVGTRQTGKLIIANNIFENCGIMTDSAAISILNNDIRTVPVEPQTSTDGVRYVTVTGNHIYGGSRNGIQINKCRDILINGNIIKDVPYRAINMIGVEVSNIQIVNNNITLLGSNSTGIIASSPTSIGCMINNNMVIGDNNQTLIAGISASGLHHQISNNTVINCYYGIVGSTLQRSSIRGNTVVGSFHSCIKIDATTAGNNTKLTVAGNDLKDSVRGIFMNANVDKVVSIGNVFDLVTNPHSNVDLVASFQESNNIIIT